MSRIYHHVLVLASTLLLTSCAWFPEPTERAKTIAMPAMNKTLASARANLPVSDRWPRQAWWEIFGSPDLNDLIETAVADNPDLKGVMARLRQSQSLVDEQAAELYPTVEANVSFSAQRFSANSTQAKLAGEHFRQLLLNPFVLRYHLDLWGRDKAALEAAIGKAMAKETELADARLLLSVAVARGYFDLAASTEKQRIAEQLVACYQRLMTLIQVRVDNGLATPAPLLRMQLKLNEARQQLTAVGAEIERQHNQLAALAGKGPDWGRKLVAGLTPLPERLPLPEQLPLHLLAHRPDVIATRLRVQAAAQEIEVARTSFYPDVNLIAFSGLHSVSISDLLLEGSSLAYAVGPTLEFPIFEGGVYGLN
nr:efflux transporter outer membrane subunit [Methylomarinum sp. Ch1-1]MDP4520755.1 efflux transporter outer membrane subunit [Methylomarinum sp. Ch1-1]